MATAQIHQHPSAASFRTNRAPLALLPAPRLAAPKIKGGAQWCPHLHKWIVTRVNNDGSREQFVHAQLSQARQLANRILPDLIA